MQQSAYLLLCLLVSLLSWSQPKAPAVDLRVIQAVMEDAPNGFVHIQLRPLGNGIFESNQVMPGAETAAVVSSDKSLTWCSYYPRTRSKESAAIIYTRLYNALSNALLRIHGSPYILNTIVSNCGEPDRVRCSFFRLIPGKGIAATISVTLLMVYRNSEYRVELAVRGKPDF